VTTLWVTPVYENITSSGSTEPYHYWPLGTGRIDQRLLDDTTSVNGHEAHSEDSSTCAK
jgi:hypothetical protein